MVFTLCAFGQEIIRQEIQTLNSEISYLENGRFFVPDELHNSRALPSPLNTHAEVIGEVWKVRNLPK